MKTLYTTFQIIVSDCIIKKLPKYTLAAIDDIKEVISITEMCPWTFTPIDTVKLFFTKFIGTAIVIALISLLWCLWGGQISTELFYLSNTPNWMLPIVLMPASKIFTRVSSEIIFGYK